MNNQLRYYAILLSQLESASKEEVAPEDVGYIADAEKAISLHQQKAEKALAKEKELFEKNIEEIQLTSSWKIEGIEKTWRANIEWATSMEIFAAPYVPQGSENDSVTGDFGNLSLPQLQKEILLLVSKLRALE